MFILHIPNSDMVFIILFRYHIYLHDQGVEIVNWLVSFRLVEKHKMFLSSTELWCWRTVKGRRRKHVMICVRLLHHEYSREMKHDQHLLFWFCVIQSITVIMYRAFSDCWDATEIVVKLLATPHDEKKGPRS